VILCNTGVALLAYMDGITGSPTLGGVVLATAAAAGSAVYKVSIISCELYCNCNGIVIYEILNF